MIAVLPANHLLDNIIFNKSLEIEISVKANSFDLFCRGKQLNEQFINCSSQTFHLKAEPYIERFYHLEFEGYIRNQTAFIENYDISILFYQGNTVCGKIEKSGFLNPNQILHYQKMIWFPFL